MITDFPRCKQRCRNVARVRHRRYMKARTSAPNPTFAHTGAADVKSCIIRGKRVQELQID